MENLFRQARDRRQTQGRDVKTVRGPRGTALRYRLPDGREFFIEPNGYPCGDPEIYSQWAREIGLPAGHKSHHFGDGWCCVGEKLSQLELYQILYQIDAWTKGAEIWKRTRRFPADPVAAFRRR